jgi:hypothetical protein
MLCISDYDVKLLMALNESLKGDAKFTDFLFNNGFPELAAFSAAVHSDTVALDWLLNNGFPELAILSNAIDGEDNAIQWLLKNNCHFMSLFAAACRKEEEAIKWFANYKLDVFLFLVRTIHDQLLFQSWDSSDPYRMRRT